VSLEFDFYDAVCGVEKLQRNDWLMQCMLLLRDTAVNCCILLRKCARWCHCNWTFSTQFVLVADVTLKTVLTAAFQRRKTTPECGRSIGLTDVTKRFTSLLTITCALCMLF